MAAIENGASLPYVKEIILKKRRSKDNREEQAILRRNQLQLGAAAAKKRKAAEAIKRPEDFLIQFRAKELDLLRMKQRKKRKLDSVSPKSKLLFVLRIQGKNDMHPKTRKVLYGLRLRRIFNGVFVKVNEGVLEKLQKVEPFVTYGYPNLKTVKDIIYKKGYAIIAKERIPLTDNNVIEQQLGKYGIICIEDIVHEIATVGPHFNEVIHFLGPFSLTKPEDGVLHGIKKRYADGGESGNREDAINDLITKMN